MTISDEQLDYISANLTFHGIKDENLRDDLIDHICSAVENADDPEFDTAYAQAIRNLGGYGALQLLQHDKNEKRLMAGVLKRKKILYMLSSFNLMLLCWGLLSKIFEWPLANVFTAIAFGLLLFVTIPFAFYERYRSRAQKIILRNQ